jgi:hypothetical protein
MHRRKKEEQTRHKIKSKAQPMVTTHFPSNNQFQVKELSGNGHYYDEAE